MSAPPRGRRAAAKLQKLLDVSRFQILRRLGEGLAGTVVLSVDRTRGEQVAVKVITNPLPELRLRLTREVEILRQVDHEAMVPLLDADLDADPPWLSFPFYPQGDLAGPISRDVPFTAEEVRAVGVRLAGALEALHEVGTLHRDVKPANVLLDAEGRAHLADFGLGRGADAPTLTATGMILGSPRYMPSDVLIQGRLADEASDQYALAVTLGEMVLGVTPGWQPGEPVFDAEELAALRPVELRNALRRALRARAQDRFPHMGAFLAALEEVGAGGAPGQADISDEAATEEETVSVSRVELPNQPPTQAPPPPPRRRSPGVLAALALVALGGLAWTLAPRAPPAPSLPEPTSPPTAGRATLGARATVQVHLDRPARVRWQGTERWWEATAGELHLPLPRPVPTDLVLEWREGGRFGFTRWPLEELLAPLLLPLAPGQRADILREVEAGVTDGAEAALAAFERLVDTAPLLLSSPLPRPLRRRVFQRLEEGEAIAMALGEVDRRTVALGRPGYHGVDDPGPELPLLARVGPDEMDQPGDVLVDHGAPGRPSPAWRLKSVARYQKVLDTPWRQLQQRVLLVWPTLEGRGSDLVRVRLITVGNTRGVRVLLVEDPREQVGGDDLAAQPEVSPEQVFLHWGGLAGAHAPEPSPHRFDVDIPADLLPAGGTPMQLRLEVVEGTERAILDVHALEVRALPEPAG